MVGETDDLIAVHKPASVPVHVSGQYRKNTVMALLQLERPDLGRLFPVHRLDKPVSGLLLFAKNAAAAHDVCTQIMVSTQHCWEGILCQPAKYHEHLHILSGELHVLAGAGLMLHSFANITHMQLVEHAAGTLVASVPSSTSPVKSLKRASWSQDLGAVRKAYIARVLGSFPSYPVTVDKHLAWDSRSKHAFLMESDGSVSQKQSLGIVPEAIQTQKLVAREAQTGFTLLSVAPDGKTSLVECQPKTGRTHQIR